MEQEEKRKHDESLQKIANSIFDIEKQFLLGDEFRRTLYRLRIQVDQIRDTFTHE